MPSRSTTVRRLATGAVAASLAVLAAACAAPAAPPAPSGPTAPAGVAVGAPANAASGYVDIAPAAVHGTSGEAQSGPAAGAASGGSGSASTDSAIAYPYFGGTPGVAPDHTIVVTGYGQASMRADGADRAPAQGKALEAAVADARSQADAIAKLAGVTITGVWSVSASSGGAYAVPMAVGSGAAGVPPAAPDASAAAVPVPAPVTGTPVSFSISVTVAYQIGA